MSRVVVLSALSLMVGLAAGTFAIAPMMGDDSTASTSQGANAPALTLAETSSKNTPAPAARSNSSDSSTASKQAQAALAASQQREQELQQQLNALTTDLDTEKTQRERLESALKVAIDAGFDPGDSLSSPEEKAARAAKAKSLLGSVKDAIASKNKDKLLASMRELEKLGTGAAAEFFEAYVAAVATGQPSFMGGSGNTLGLTFQEYVGLMGNTMRDHALASTPGTVPLSAQMSAVAAQPWLVETPREERVQKLSGLLSQSTDNTLNSSIIGALAQIGGSDAIATLSSTSTSGAYSEDVRVSAINSMARLGDDADWDTIASLQNDPSEKVSSAARRVTTQRQSQSRYDELRSKPPGTGYLVRSVSSGSAAERGGLQALDLIVNFDAQAIISTEAFMTAIQAAVEAQKQTVQVEVLRGEQRIFLTMGVASRLGVDGQFVRP